MEATVRNMEDGGPSPTTSYETSINDTFEPTLELVDEEAWEAWEDK